MAPKRAAKKAAPPPPPPPPPAESSDDETRSSSDESEDEEAIADSPVLAPTSTLKNAPAPSHKGGESESSSSEEDDEDEEEEDQPVRAPSTRHPLPPQEKEDSDTSGSDDEEEEEEPAPKNQPPPAPKNQHRDESDASYEEEEEEEEEVPPPKPTPNKDLKPPGEAADKAKKPGPFHRIWSTDDEIRILESLAAHHKEHGTLPQPEDLLHGLNGKLDNPSYASKDLQSKVKSLRTRYLTLSKRPELPTKEHDRLVLDLSKIIWGHGGRKTATRAVATRAVATRAVATRAVATRAVASNGQETKGFEEMCELYPYLAEEVKGLEAVHPGMCKRGFGKMDDGKARAMDEKIKRQRVAQIKLEMCRADLAKEVAKALVDLVCG